MPSLTVRVLQSPADGNLQRISLVAEKGDSVVGGTELVLLRLRRHLTVGCIKEPCTDNRYGESGIADLLLDKAGEVGRQHGCTDLCAFADGDDATLSGPLAERGFSPLSLSRQVRMFGLGTLRLWHRLSRPFDTGHFLWHRRLDRPTERRPARTAFGAAVLGNTLLWAACMQGWNLLHLAGTATGHPGWADGIDSLTVPSQILVPALFLMLRALAMEVSAKVQDLEIEFRGWDTAWIAALLTTFLVGFPFPVAGNFYIKGGGDPETAKGKLAMLSRSSQLAVAIGCLFFVRSFALLFALPLLVLDTLFFFRPFCGFNARRLLYGGPATKSGSYALLLVVSFFVLI